MSEWKEHGKRLLEQAELLRIRMAKLLADGRARKSEAEIEVLRARLRDLETRIRGLGGSDGALGELRDGAAQAAEGLKAVWRRASAKTK